MKFRHLKRYKVKETKVKRKEKDTSEKTSFSAEAHSLAVLFLGTLTAEQRERISESDLTAWKKSLDKTLKKYSFAEIEKMIKVIRADDFWVDQFLSPCKLEKKNKDGVRYPDVFLAKVNKKQPEKFNPGKTDTRKDTLVVCYQKKIGKLCEADQEEARQLIASGYEVGS